MDDRGGPHDRPRLIAAWAYATGGDLAELQPARTPQGSSSVSRLAELLSQPARICWNLPRRPVWHCSIHNHPDDPTLADGQWQHIATEIVAAAGLAPPDDLDAVRWIGIRHHDRHIHIVATLARQDRDPVTSWHDYRRAQTRCRELEQQYGLHRLDGHRTTEPHPTGAELHKTSRLQRDEVPRRHLRRTVRAAAQRARDERDFLDQLRGSGVLVRPRTSLDPAASTGYAVALPDDYNAAGDTIWYSGASLAADLTLPKLRRTWQAP